SETADGLRQHRGVALLQAEDVGIVSADQRHQLGRCPMLAQVVRDDPHEATVPPPAGCRRSSPTSQRPTTGTVAIGSSKADTRAMTLMSQSPASGRLSTAAYVPVAGSSSAIVWKGPRSRSGRAALTTTESGVAGSSL